MVSGPTGSNCKRKIKAFKQCHQDHKVTIYDGKVLLLYIMVSGLIVTFSHGKFTQLWAIKIYQSKKWGFIFYVFTSQKGAVSKGILLDI